MKDLLMSIRGIRGLNGYHTRRMLGRSSNPIETDEENLRSLTNIIIFYQLRNIFVQIPSINS